MIGNHSHSKGYAFVQKNALSEICNNPLWIFLWIKPFLHNSVIPVFPYLWKKSMHFYVFLMQKYGIV